MITDNAVRIYTAANMRDIGEDSAYICVTVSSHFDFGNQNDIR